MDDKLEQQIMVIAWKWRHLPQHINQRVLKEVYENKLPAITKGKDKFFSEFGVERSELCPHARLIAVSIYNDGDLTHRFLEGVLKRYLPPVKKHSSAKPLLKDHAKVILFLHRGNNYTEEDVTRLLKAFKNQVHKVFLFSDKRDYLYYATQKEGLLDDIGGFAYGKDEHTGEKFSVLNQKSYKINQPYFDRVWQYYTNEFESKVFSLKEDLFECLFPFMMPESPVAVSLNICLRRIKAVDNGLLWFRLKSFMGEYDAVIKKDPDNFEVQNRLEAEIEIIMDAEKKQKKSLLFDDCIANLKQQKLADRTFISEVYEGINLDLHNCLLNKQKGAEVKIADLRKLAKNFNYLVKIIPGVMD